jgi:ketosteroid isomerase-like protein
MFDGEAMRSFATRYFDLMQAGDLDEVLRCYAPDARIWHNTDGIEESPEENVARLAASGTRVVDRVYVDRRLEVFPNGFVQQHVLRGTRVVDGAVVELPACLVAEVRDGRITRLDGYFDSAAVAEFTRGA